MAGGEPGDAGETDNEGDWGELVPRLVRIYGGTPRTWISETPIAYVRCCVAMLPRLQAEEQIAHTEAVSLGTGSLPRDVSRAISTRLHTQAFGAASQARAVKAKPQDLAGLGIGCYLKDRARG